MIAYPTPQAAFREVMQRTIVLVGEKVSREQLQEVAKVFQTMCWHFRDLGQNFYFVVTHAGEVQAPEAVDTEPQTTITIDSRVFHDAAFGKTSLTSAFFLGKLKVKGLPVLKLGKFTPLMKPFLESYCEACENHHEQRS